MLRQILTAIIVGTTHGFAPLPIEGVGPVYYPGSSCEPGLKGVCGAAIFELACLRTDFPPPAIGFSFTCLPKSAKPYIDTVCKKDFVGTCGTALYPEPSGLTCQCIGGGFGCTEGTCRLSVVPSPPSPSPPETGSQCSPESEIMPKCGPIGNGLICVRDCEQGISPPPTSATCQPEFPVEGSICCPKQQTCADGLSCTPSSILINPSICGPAHYPGSYCNYESEIVDKCGPSTSGLICVLSCQGGIFPPPTSATCQPRFPVEGSNCCPDQQTCADGLECQGSAILLNGYQCKKRK